MFAFGRPLNVQKKQKPAEANHQRNGKQADKEEPNMKRLKLKTKET